MNRRDFLRLSAATAAAVAVPVAAAKALAAAPALQKLAAAVSPAKVDVRRARRITRWSLTARNNMQEFFAIGRSQPLFRPGILTTEVEWEQVVLPSDEVADVLPCPDELVTLQWFKDAGVPVPDHFPETKYMVTDVRLEMRADQVMTAHCKALEMLTSKSART